MLQNKSTFQFSSTLSHYIFASIFHHCLEAINLFERANCTVVCMWKFKGQNYVFLAQTTSFKLKHLIVHEFRFLCANFFDLLSFSYMSFSAFQTSDPFFHRRFYAYLSGFPPWKTIRAHVWKKIDYVYLETTLLAFLDQEEFVIGSGEKVMKAWNLGRFLFYLPCTRHESS